MDEQKVDDESKSRVSQGFLQVALLFFLSGASSLIYQVIWTRQMVFVFGSSTFASATVLSAFMGGLALGSFVAGKFADRIRNTFLAYGLLEAAIGVWALLLPLMFGSALPFYKFCWQHFHLSVLPFSILRFLVVSLILLPPTACMGATLPLLARFITEKIADVADRVGSLYAINTLGAVFGALFGGFVLIPNYGLNASTITAAAVNLFLAAAVVTLVRSQAKAGNRKTLTPLDEETSAVLPLAAIKAEPLNRATIATMIVFGLSGAIAMIYEVAWTRALCLVIGSTTYAFTIMLATFLIGISSGSFIAARITDRLKYPLFVFALLQLLLGISGRVSLELFNYLPYWNLIANYHILGNANLAMLVRFLLASIILLPVALLLGAIFPLAVKICTNDFEKLGRSIGNLYSINTLGAIAGSSAAGFLIIPSIGGEHALLCSAAANFVLGSVLIILFCSAGNIVRKAASALLSLLVISGAVQEPKIWDLHTLTAGQKIRRGLNYNHYEILPYKAWKDHVDKNFDILFWKDGLCANVAIVRFDDGQISLFTNGHIDASDGSTDMPTQALLPSFPLLIKPDSKTVADVGWGSGCTMGYALLFPLDKIVCAEIEPVVIDTSKFFHRVNLSPESDPRLRLETNDGRNFLLATDEKFDLITSEPSNPWQAGVCNLYTREYFQTCHDRLNPAGIFAMWWQCNEVSSENLTRVFAALKAEFKQVVVFQPYPGDIVVCSSDQPIKINLDRTRAALKDRRLKGLLKENADFSEAEDLALAVRMTNAAVEKVVANVEANTDDRNRIEFDLSKNYEQKTFTTENHRWLLQNSGNVTDVVDWGKMPLAERAEKMTEIAERAMLQHNDMAEIWAEESYKIAPSSYALSVHALILAQRNGDFDRAFAIANESVQRFSHEERPFAVRGIIEMLAGAPLRARHDFEAALDLAPQNPVYKFRLAQTYMPEFRDWYQTANLPMADIGSANTDPNKTVELIAPSLADAKFVKQNPTANATYAAALFQLGRTDECIKKLIEFQDARPNDIMALRLLAQAYLQKGYTKNANSCTQRAAELSKTQADKLCQSVQSLLFLDKPKLALNLLKRALKYDSDCAQARLLLKDMATNDKDAESFMKELK